MPADSPSEDLSRVYLLLLLNERELARERGSEGARERERKRGGEGEKERARAHAERASGRAGERAEWGGGGRGIERRGGEGERGRRGAERERERDIEKGGR